MDQQFIVYCTYKYNDKMMAAHQWHTWKPVSPNASGSLLAHERVNGPLYHIKICTENKRRYLISCLRLDAYKTTALTREMYRKSKVFAHLCTFTKELTVQSFDYIQ